VKIASEREGSVGRLRGIVVGVVVLAFVVTACSSNGNGGSSGGGGGAVATTPAAGGDSGGGGSSPSVTVQGFAFSPDSLNVSAGTVKVTVTNKDSTEHTFTLDDGSSSTNLDPGKSVTITLDVSKTVGFHCNIHPSMTGTLNVA
jgi:plastocyanin